MSGNAAEHSGYRSEVVLGVEFEELEKHGPRLVRDVVAPVLRGTKRNSEEEGRG